jgi:hypothetical protein
MVDMIMADNTEIIVLMIMDMTIDMDMMLVIMSLLEPLNKKLFHKSLLEDQDTLNKKLFFDSHL